MCANLDPSWISPSSVHDKGQIGSKESATFTTFALLETPQIVHGRLYRFHDYFSVLHMDQHDIVLNNVAQSFHHAEAFPSIYTIVYLQHWLHQIPNVM